MLERVMEYVALKPVRNLVQARWLETEQPFSLSLIMSSLYGECKCQYRFHVCGHKYTSLPRLSAHPLFKHISDALCTADTKCFWVISISKVIETQWKQGGDSLGYFIPAAFVMLILSQADSGNWVFSCYRWHAAYGCECTTASTSLGVRKLSITFIKLHFRKRCNENKKRNQDFN